MVNEASPTTATDRRERTRPGASDATRAALGVANLNPFGDLHSLQHLSARLARSMRAPMEGLLRRELRVWAEPLVVQRFADYRAERPEGLTAWLPMAMAPTPGKALMVLDGRFVLELLDLFFGGSGHAPAHLPAEFPPSADAMVVQVATMLLPQLHAAWEPLARVTFTPGKVEANGAMLQDFDGEDAMIVTRFGIATGDAKPAFLDLIYPVAALKPHASSLTAKVLGRTPTPDPAWRNELTRAVMAVKFPVRSVLAEATISLGYLMDLKAGDVIPISFGQEVPVMVGTDRLGLGTVGTSNGRTAIKLNSLAALHEEDYR
ncbi:flagellar motor switch protein FliM [soil metagenome]